MKEEDAEFTKNTRWRSFLLNNSPAFAALVSEREAGWASPALDAWYQQRRPTAPPAVSSSPATVVGSAGSVFGELDTEALNRLCDRYATHAATVLESLWKQQAGNFLDLGAAPGGVSYALLEKRWTGVGVSLAVAKGGIALSERLSHSIHNKAYHYLEASILDPSLPQMAVEAMARGHEFRFDFVNGGAVQDHGQRASLSDEQKSEYVLPWFNFLGPQLTTALRCTKDGGTVMIVYGVSHCGSLLRLVQWLLEKHILSTVADVEIHSTIHPGKPPLYVMFKHVRCPTEETVAELDQLLKTQSASWWQLEDDDVFSEASKLWLSCDEGGHSCAVRVGLEAAWNRTREFLKGQRERAELAMERSKRKRGRDF